MQENPVIAAIWEALRRVDDPELGVNIVDLGLVYGVDVSGPAARVTMTMTSPACPLGPYLADAVERAVLDAIDTIEAVEVEIVWDPPWDESRMSPTVRAGLGR